MPAPAGHAGYGVERAGADLRKALQGNGWTARGSALGLKTNSRRDTVMPLLGETDHDDFDAED